MSLTEKQHTTENFYIYLEQKQAHGTSYYEVAVCPLKGDGECGSPIRSATYPIEEKTKAESTYRRYKRTYQ